MSADYGSALQGAANRGHVGVVRLLLERGADVSAAGGEDGSALQCAASAYGDHTEIVRLLLAHGADVNATGGKYGSALQAAAVRGASGGYGSALRAASLGGYNKIVELLREHGALDAGSGE
ncbi:ankyrin repeat-containing domain protein [Mycena vitilis]|nr:ankyrin repeat-containing domain protein [Mycena vitilis]